MSLEPQCSRVQEDLSCWLKRAAQPQTCPGTNGRHSLPCIMEPRAGRRRCVQPAILSPEINGQPYRPHGFRLHATGLAVREATMPTDAVYARHYALPKLLQARPTPRAQSCFSRHDSKRFRARRRRLSERGNKDCPPALETLAGPLNDPPNFRGRGS